MTQLTPQVGHAFRSPEDYPAVRALLFVKQGETTRVEHEIQVAVRLGKADDHFHHAAFIIASAYAEMGKPHEAVLWLRRTSEIGMPNYPLFHDNPSLKKLAGNPEYEHFMAEFKPRWDQFAAFNNCALTGHPLRASRRSMLGKSTFLVSYKPRLIATAQLLLGS